MSDTRTPPTDEGGNSHPDEVLAGYVDGSATADERALVEAHLAACMTCRQEVELAGIALGAVRSLTEVQSPGLAGSVLEGVRADRAQSPAAAGGAATAGTFAAGGSGERHRRREPARWQRSLVAVGLAAAAVFGAVFVVRLAGTSTPSATGGGAARAPGAEAAAPPILDAGADYTSDSLDALAQQIASSTQTSESGGVKQSGAVPGPTSGGSSGPLALDRDPQHIDRALTCLRTATGLALEGALRLERATFEGRPAWIGAFVVPGASGGKAHAVVVAASIDGCQPLHIASQAL
jgi:putative zinc finger protein